MKNFSLTALAGLAILSLSGAANALTYGPFSAIIPTAPVPFTYSFTLPTFDTTLGTLTGVTIDLSTNATATVSVANFTNVPQQFTNAFATVPITVTNTTGPNLTSATSTVTAGPTSGTVGTGAGNNITSVTGLTGTATGSLSVPSSQFAFYQTVGGAPATFTAAGNLGTYTGTADTGVFFGGSASTGGTVIITYTYSLNGAAVPEPGSVAILIAGGVTGAGLFVRRRRSK